MKRTQMAIAVCTACLSTLSPPTASGEEIIIDNADPSGVTVTGSWSTATVAGSWGGNCLSDGNAGKGTKSVRFTPTITEAGDYDIYIRGIAVGLDSVRAASVPVDIISDSGNTTVTISQQQDGFKWMLLGTAHFSAGNTGGVVIRNDGTTGYVNADAVKFLTAGTPQNTLVERLTPMETPRMLSGLGWNIHMDQEWEFQKVKEAGGSEVRMEFGWSQVEAMDGTLALTSAQKTALSWCVKYGLQPLVLASYGSPRAKLCNLTVTSNVAAGSTVIPVSGTAALPYTDLSGLVPVVVDNVDVAGITKSGTWTTVTSTSGYLGSYLSDQGAGKGTGSVRFTPILPAAGEYDIYIRYPSASNHSGAVPVDVISAAGTTTVSVAQNGDGGAWNHVLRTQCAAGTGNSVLIRNEGTTAGSLVVADAFMWVPVAVVEAPIHACHVLKSDGSNIVPEGKWAYYGALIDAVDPVAGTITMAAKTNIALTAGTVLTVNKLRYASAATNSGADPNWVAYARYAKFLADQVAAYGLTGRVELWNEPPWAHDKWDHRGGFYDTVPTGVTANSPNYGMLRAVVDQTLPPGVRYSWGGSHKSGWKGTLDGPMPKPTRSQVENTVPTQGAHPYRVTPEAHLWYPDQLMTASNVFSTYLEGTDATSNFKSGRRNRAAALAANGWTVSDQISETGNLDADDTVQARWLTRAFLSNLCIGPAPFTDRVNFYRLTSLPGDLGIINSNTRVERQAYTAMKCLMADVRHLRAGALPFTDADLPTIAPGYAGRWPLMTIPLVGRADPSEAKNHQLFVCYQRSYAHTDEAWSAISTPPAPVTVNIPAGYTARRAWDLVTRQPIPITVSGSTVTYSVADNATVLQLVPPTVIGQAPVAASDSPNIDESGTADLDVLANDSDPDFGPEAIFLQSVTQPAHGTATIVNGQVRYSPAAGFYGTDSFTYAVSDGDQASTGTVTVTVNSTATANDLTAFGLSGGAVGAGGGSSRVLADGTWEVNGSGAGAGGSADAFWLESSPQTTGGFRARVLMRSFAGASDARGGIMIREGTGPGARFVSVGAAPDGSTRVAWRTTGNGTAVEQTAASPDAFPGKWLMIERIGGEIVVSTDDNNSGYREISRIPMSNLAASLQASLFACGGAGGTNGRAVFSNHEITPLVTWDGGAGSQNWTDANNWDPNGAPAASLMSNVALPNGSTFVVKQNAAMSGSNSNETLAIRLGSVSIGPDATLLRGGYQDFFTGRNFSGGVARTTGVVNNAGTMRNETPSTTWLFRWSPVAHTNSGTIEARNSAATVQFDSGGATLNNTGGSIKATSGGKIYFSTTLGVSGGGISSDATSQIQMSGDGTLPTFSGVQVSNAGTWLVQQASGATGGRVTLAVINGNTTFSNSGILKVRQAMTSSDANAQSATFEVRGSSSLTNSASGTLVVTNESTATTPASAGSRIARLDFPETGTSFTNFGNVTISDAAAAGLNARAELRSATTLVNQGHITISGPRAFLTANGSAAFRQSAGSLTLANGTLSAASAIIDAGTLKGTGMITGGLAIGNGASFEAALAADGSANLVSVSGSVVLGGALQVVPASGFTPAPGAEVRIMTTTGGISGGFGTTTIGYAAVVRGNDLYVVVTENLSLWRARHFSAAELARPEISGPDADPEGDGIPNLLEYGLGLNPRVADQQNRRITVGTTDGRLTLTVTRSRPCPPDIVYEAQASGNLAIWDPLAFGGDPIDNHDGTETLTATDNLAPASAPHRFVRLRIRAPAP